MIWIIRPISGANGFSPPPPIRYRTIPKVEDPMRAQNDVGVGNANDKKSPPSQPDHQCGAKVEIISRIKKSPALVREAEIMGKNQKTQIEANHLINQLSLGNRNPGTGSKSLKGCKNVSYLRGDKGARIFYRETKEGIEILGKANKKNEQKVIDILRTIYN